MTTIKTQSVILIAAALPDVVSLLEINTFLIHGMQLLIKQMPVHKNHQKHLAFSWQGQQCTFI